MKITEPSYYALLISSGFNRRSSRGKMGLVLACNMGGKMGFDPLGMGVKTLSGNGNFVLTH